MVDEPPLQYMRPYLDSSVYIAAINKEVVDGVERWRIAQQILKEAEKGFSRFGLAVSSR